MLKAKVKAKGPAKAKTAEQYLAGLPPERRAALTAVRNVVRKHLPAGYEEAMAAGIMTWEVPLNVYPDTYNGHALWYVALASQKNYASLYLMGVYGTPRLQQRLADGFKRAGKRLDMGKSCVHFTDSEDLALDVIGEVIAAVPMRDYIASAEAARTRGSRRAAVKR